MNKKILIGVAVLVTVIALGVGIFKSSAAQANPKLSIDEIKEMVMVQYPGEIAGLELATKGTTAMYQVEVVYENKSYKMKLDGNTGEIVHLVEADLADKEIAMETEKEEITLNNEQATTPSVEPEDTGSLEKSGQKEKEKPKATEKSGNVETTPKSKRDESASHHNKYYEKNKQRKEKYKNMLAKHEESAIGIEKGIEIALREFPGTVIEAELDRNNGRLIYEVEIIANGEEADFEIDAKTGEVIELKKKSTKKLQPEKTAIDIKKAIEIAVSEFPGTVTEVELDRNNGRLIYEVEIKANNKEADFDIDAHTGKVISIEIDND